MEFLFFNWAVGSIWRHNFKIWVQYANYHTTTLQWELWTIGMTCILSWWYCFHVSLHCMRYFPKLKPRLLYKRLTSEWKFMEVEEGLTRGKEWLRWRGVLIASTNSNSIFFASHKAGSNQLSPMYNKLCDTIVASNTAWLLYDSTTEQGMSRVVWLSGRSWAHQPNLSVLSSHHICYRACCPHITTKQVLWFPSAESYHHHLQSVGQYNRSSGTSLGASTPGWEEDEGYWSMLLYINCFLRKD